MQPTTNIVELADELAEIARTARDAALATDYYGSLTAS
jgi:hypothetical protein